jgi:hypothetical protein
MLDHEVEGYRYVYVDTESIDSEQAFYKKLLKEILKLHSMESMAVKLLKSVGNAGRKIKSIKLAEIGIEFHEAQDNVSYYEDLVHFLTGIHLEKNKKLILLIDEFPQTILNIVNTSGPEAAIRFLQSNRTLRLDPNIINKVRFIYTGSIGLNHTVAAIDSTAFINDLNTLEIEPLSKKEATHFLNELIRPRKIRLEPETHEYLLAKLEWLIPFHIQLLVQELLRLDIKEGQIDIQHIDQAFEAIIASRNDNYFMHYYNRLKTQFKGDELKFALDILRMMAESGDTSRIQMFDTAARLNQENSYKKVIEILIYDGYINNIGNKEQYRFNSPVIRMWWCKYVCK